MKRARSEEEEAALWGSVSAAESNSSVHQMGSVSAAASNSSLHQTGSVSAAASNPPRKRARLSAEEKKPGWSAAKEEASKRSDEEYAEKKAEWTAQIENQKNAFARKIVENAFAVHTPKSWTGMRFEYKDAVPEKQVIPEGLNSVG